MIVMKQFKVFLQRNIVSAICIVLISIATAFIYYFIANNLLFLFNDGFAKNNIEMVKNRLVWAVFLYAAQFVLNMAFNAILLSITWDGIRNIGLLSINNMFRTNREYIIEKDVAFLWQEVNMSSQQLGNFFSKLLEAVFHITQFVIYVVVLVNIHTIVCLLLLSIIPLVFFATNRILKRVNIFTGQYFGSSSVLASRVLESVANAKTIKAQKAYDYFLESIRKNINQNMNDDIHMKSSSFFSLSIVELFNVLSPLLILYIVLRLTNLMPLTIGETIMLYSVAPLMLASFKKLYGVALSYFSTKPAIMRINKYNTLGDENSGNTGIKIFESLVCSHVSISAKNHTVYIPDFEIAKGDRVLILGESGIGKSTLFYVLLGLRKNYNGNCILNGVEIAEYRCKDLRELFGISMQNHSLFSSLSLKDNILIGQSEKTSDALENLLTFAELTNVYNSKECTDVNDESVSGGEKARISIAQSLANDPQVILLDETLSSVDESMELKILEKIIAAYPSKTLIYINHRSSNTHLFNKKIVFSKNEVTHE